MKPTTKLRFRTIAVALAIPMLAGSVAVGAPTADETNVAERINVERDLRDRRLLRHATGLNNLAHQHSCEMAAAGSLYHTQDLGKKVKRWRILAENVGQGWDLEVVHQEFMGSEHHRNNILDKRFTHVGTGVCLDEWNNYWVTQIFFA